MTLTADLIPLWGITRYILSLFLVSAAVIGCGFVAYETLKVPANHVEAERLAAGKPPLVRAERRNGEEEVGLTALQPARLREPWPAAANGHAVGGNSDHAVPRWSHEDVTGHAVLRLPSLDGCRGPTTIASRESHSGSRSYRLGLDPCVNGPFAEPRTGGLGYAPLSKPSSRDA